MKTSVIRAEVLTFVQACHAFAEFSRDKGELTIAEREAIGNSLVATLSTIPLID